MPATDTITVKVDTDAEPLIRGWRQTADIYDQLATAYRAAADKLEASLMPQQPETADPSVQAPGPLICACGYGDQPHPGQPCPNGVPGR